MACSSEQVRKASILSLFGAVRASMAGCEEEKTLLERLAIRLDILAALGSPVSRDPEVEELLSKLSSSECMAIEWIAREICALCVCMGIACKREEG